MAYLGFKKLKGQLAKKPGIKNPGAVAASIGRKKYGAGTMAKASSSGLPAPMVDRAAKKAASGGY